MAASIGIISAGVSAAATTYSASESHQARKDAEWQAAQQREAFAALQAEPEPALPSEDATRKARRLSISNQMRRRGRASTILTQPSGTETLGAG